MEETTRQVPEQPLKISFLEVSPGNKSSGRRSQWIVILTGIVTGLGIAGTGLWVYATKDTHESLMSIAQAFTFVIAGVVIPVGGWHVAAKVAENK